MHKVRIEKKFQSLRKGKYPSKPTKLLPAVLVKLYVSIPEKREIPFEEIKPSKGEKK